MEKSKYNPDLTRREFLGLVPKAVALAAGAGILLENEAHAKEIEPIKRTYLQEVKPAHNMPGGVSRFEIHAEVKSGKEKLVGSFFAMESGNESRLEFLSRKKHPQFFTPEINFQAIKDFYQQQGKQVALEVAGAFTPDWKQIEGLAYENGESVGQDKPAAHSGLLVIKNGKPSIEQLHSNTTTSLVQNAVTNKWSLFQQLSAIQGGKIVATPSLAKPIEARFFVERKTPAGITAGIVNFSEHMTVAQAIDALMKMDNGTSRIENAIYLDTGAVSEGYFYTKDGVAHKMVDEQFSQNGVQRKDNLKRYTNLIVLTSGK